MSVENQAGNLHNAAPETGAAEQNERAQQQEAPRMQSETSRDAHTPTRRMLYRHPTDTVLGGVCGGLADYFGWDAALIRILWVVLTLATSGGGLLAYLALWIVLPVGTTGAGQERPAALELNERNLVRAAWILIALGAVWLLGNLGILPWLWGGFWRAVSIVFWPLLLIGVGYVLLRYTGKTMNWRFGLNGTADQVKSTVGERMPDKASIKSGMNQFRQKLPLKRSREDRIWMGVCGGIGKRLGIDSNLVRLIWAAFSVGSIGMGVLIYVIAGLFLVEEEQHTARADQLPYRDEEAHDVQIIDAASGRSA